jgi:hypothetical protein
VNTTARDDISTYVETVRAALADLPSATRDELLEDLPEHLAEVQAEDTGSLVDRLGTPEAYAAELRATAGLTRTGESEDRYAEVRANLLRRMRAADAWLGPLLGYERASEFLLLLRPAWWVLRGYLAAMVVARALDDSGQPIGLLPRIGGSELVAVLLLAAAVLGSVWLGRRASRRPWSFWPRYAFVAGSALLVLVAIVGFAAADSDVRGSGYATVDYGNNGGPYENVQDVFVYDREGRLVNGARLFDQDGQPIQLGNAYCVDESTGESKHTQNMGYPYCPENAPFTEPSASAAPGPSASGLAPSATASPPSTSARPRPSSSR